jgi:2'-5' RNA ligase
MRVCVILLLLASISTSTVAIPINIHVRLSNEARGTVEALAARMKVSLSNDEIDFQKQFIPHVTLYLTDFQPAKIKDVIVRYVWPPISSSQSLIVSVFTSAHPLWLTIIHRV